MKAAVLQAPQQPLVIEDVAVPSLGPHDVLIRVHACGVCHTDLHLADGMFKAMGSDPFPLIPGHEIAGVVAEVGTAVTHLQPGNRVGAYWWLTCGRCRNCISGEEEACEETLAQLQAIGLTRDGGYAEFVKLPSSRVMALPPEIEFADAAPFFCAGLTAYGGFKNARLQAGQRAAVLGVGGLGHMAVQIASAMGAEVIAITSTEAKRDLATQLGAHHVVTGGSGEISAKLLELGGADVVLSTTLDFQSIRDVLRGVRPLGTLVLTGLTGGRLPLDPRTFILAQQRIIGSNIGSRCDLQELLDLAGRSNIRPMTETYALDEVNQVFERLQNNQVRFRAVLTVD
jgi:propanol-preferring alcohol dehydrogenase